MADTTITILGMSGAGKTCYLLSLYYMMGAGKAGYTITTDEDTDVQLRDYYVRLDDQTLPRERRFPAGTDTSKSYTFNLEYGYRKIMDFDWIDYPGGLLDRKNSGNIEEYEKVKKSIQGSSSLIICVDGTLFSKEKSKDGKVEIDKIVQNIKSQCSNVINTFFSDYANNNRAIPLTEIVITKYDLCREFMNKDMIYEIIKKAFTPFFVKNDVEKVVTIIPVSIDKNSIGKMGIEPINIELPIFMSIYVALIKKIRNIILEIRKNEQELSKLDSKLLKEKNRIFKRKGEMAQLSGQKKSLVDKINAKNTEKESMQMYLQNMLEVLKKIKNIYIDGEKRDISKWLEDQQKNISV